jgi:hypothetical protein
MAIGMLFGLCPALSEPQHVVPLAGLVYMVSMPAGALHSEAMMWTGCPQLGTLSLSAAVAAG